jgi:hypothetical protein
MPSRKRKATVEEKDQIRRLLLDGEKVEEVINRYPEINGQVISGIAARLKTVGATESSGERTAVPPPKRPAEVPEQSRQEYKTPEQIEAEKTGFTRASETVNTGGGWKPAYKEYFVIKKLDHPNAGIIRKEYPPFTVSEFLERYEAGEYEIEHYRDGKLYQTYRDSISPRAKEQQRGTVPSGGPQVIRDAPRTDSPIDAFFRAIDFSKRLHEDRRHEDATVRAAEVTAKSAEVQAKAQFETVQTSGLVELVKEAIKPKPVEKDTSIESLVTLMQQQTTSYETRVRADAEAARERHKQEMDSLREQAKIDRERASDEAKAKVAAAKQEAEEKMERERQYMTKLQEIDSARQALWKESYDNMMTQAKEMQTSLSDEFDKKKGWLDELTEITKAHTDEVIALKKATVSSEKDLEYAKIISNGITGGLDRIGSRVDMLVNSGVLGDVRVPGRVDAPGGGPKPGDPGAAGAGGPKDPSDGQGPATKEAVKAVTKEMIKDAVKEPWFQDLQNEISLAIKKRVSATSPAGKPHGSMLGQSFLDQMNTDLRIRQYFHFLCTRPWEKLLEEIEPGLTEENKTLFKEKEAFLWFDEFQSFLILAWNNTIGVK